MKIGRFGMVLFALLPTMAHGQPAASAVESLNRPSNPGFVIGYHDKENPTAIEEWVPKGETVEKWTKMVTFQRLGDLKVQGYTPFATANKLAAMMIASCRGATSTPITLPAPDGMSIAEFSTFCPLNSATGKPENTFFKLVAGNRDILVAQVAFRRKAGGDERKWAQGFLNSVELCSSQNAQPNCGTTSPAQ